MMRLPWAQVRPWAGKTAFAAALLLLSACAGGTPISQVPTPPEPAPIPERKPPVPPAFLARQAVPVPVQTPVPAQARTAAATPGVSAAQPLPRRNPRPAAQPHPTRTAQPQPTRTAQPQPAPAQQAVRTPAPAAGTGGYVVQPGENVFSIARKHNVPIRTLLEVNRLGPPYKLSPGQRLILPTPSRHIVTRGETVYAISRRYRIDIHSLVQLNRIPPPFTISVGQVLDLPGTRNAFAAATPQPQPQPAPPTPSSQAAPTQTSTANRTGAPPVPAAKPTPGGTPNATAQVPAAAAPNSAKPQMARVQPPKPSRRPPAGVPKPPPRASSKFRWPLSGTVISSFGSKGSGVHNDGINIEAAAGTIVRAAENGVVAYSGNELRGFGRLLLLKHADGWVTAYAHLSEVMVRRGETVKRGQAVAKVGRSGNVSKPQLHFEIRQGTRAVDPRKLLGPQQAANAD